MPSTCKNRSRKSYGGAKTAAESANRILRKKAESDPSWARYFAKKNANKQVNAMLNNVRPTPYNPQFNTIPIQKTGTSSTNLSEFNNKLFQAKTNAKVNGMANSMIAHNEKTVNAAAATEEAASEANAAAEKAAEPSFMNKIMGTPSEQKAAIQVINNANNKAKNMAKLANNAAKLAANAAKVANSLKAKVNAMAPAAGGSRRTRRRRN
uniref:Uncharacterized protein n=1 Tax=viral metagenome TaxID=1070528 RepID=A0A6C0KTN0_9ZZZZ